jgi:hypothetical protein
MFVPAGGRIQWGAATDELLSAVLNVDTRMQSRMGRFLFKSPAKLACNQQALYEQAPGASTADPSQ